MISNSLHPPCGRWVGVQGRGGWNFMSFCSKQDLIDDSLCQQPYTANGAGLAGSQLAVSPSYQTTYASVSFQSPGTWLGVTFRKQFMRALQVVHLVVNSPQLSSSMTRRRPQNPLLPALLLRGCAAFCEP